MICKHCNSSDNEEDVCQDCWDRLYDESHPFYEGDRIRLGR
jgi:hypothetical protein